MSRRVALPVAVIVAFSVWGLASRILTGFQLLTLGPIVYSLIVFTLGAIKYRPRPNLEDCVPEDELPFVSIMIPAHNEENVIGNTVQHMLRLDYPRFEVIVIDDHSSDHTGAILRDYPVKVVTRRNLPNRGKSEALNAGLEVATGDVICIFDADSEVAPDFLRLAVAPLVHDPAVCGVQTQVRMYNRRTNFLTAGQDDEFALFSEITQMGRYYLGGASALGGNGQLTRRSAIKAVGGWSPASLTEDLDLTIRLLLAGRGRIAHCSEAIVWQEGVSDLKPLIRQRTRWAEGMLRCFGEFAGQVLTSENMSWGLRLDALYALGSVFLPLITVAGAFYSVASMVPHFFNSFLPYVIGESISGVGFAAICVWSLIISYKRDRRPSLMPGLRSMIYLLHWVPAMVLALRNIFMDQPVVWDKTEHRGHGGLVSSTLPPVPTPVGAVAAES